MAQEKEYYAFISYQRKDEKWADRLRNKLEHYRLPSSVRKQDASLPKEIRPIFRDALELAGGVLAKEIETALQQSKYLIVICSPNSAKSPWVNKEIQTFIDLGHEDRIIPFIIDGMPFSDNEDTECFPPALRSLKGEKELLGININELERDAACIKVVARMFGLKFDTLWQRYEREQKKRRKMVGGGLALITFVTICIAGFIWHQNRELKEVTWKMMANQQRYIAKKANELIDHGDSYLARLLLLEVLPQDIHTHNMPFVSEAESALREADKYTSAVLTGHRSHVSSVSLSHDGKKILSTSEADEIKIWDLITGKCISTITDMNHSITFSSDDNRILAYRSYMYANSYYFVVNIYDANTGEYLQTLKDLPDYITPVIFRSSNFNYDGTKCISISGDNCAIIWDTNTRKVISTIATENKIFGSSISHNGKTIALTDGNNITIWDSEKGKQLRTLKGHTDDVASLVFSPNNKYLASSTFNSSIIIWDVNSGKKICQLKDSFDYSHSHSLTFGPDGYHLALSSMSDIHIWNINSGICERNLSGHWGEVLSLCYSNDGKRIVSGSVDNNVRIWDVGSLGRILTLEGHTNTIQSISYNKTGTMVISSSNDKTVKIWNSNTGECVKTLYLPYKIRTAALSPDGKYVATLKIFSNEILIWNVKTGNVIMKLEGPLNGHWDDSTEKVSFTTNGKLLVSSSYKGAIRIWEVKTGKVLLFRNNNKNHIYNCSTVFSPDGNRIISISEGDSLLRYSDTFTGKCIWKKSGLDYWYGLNFSPSAKYIAIGNGKNILILDTIDGKLLKTLPSAGGNYIAFSHDEKKLLTSDYFDFDSLRIWDINKGKCIQVIEGGGKASFSPDGKHVLSLSESGTICIWDCQTLRELIDKTRKRFKNRQLTREERRKYYLE